ncbi:hypothetical protein MKX01_027161 [Papaver californicum]|nr:hypothetical protein MKX01_027161 [Papaver californicum]
MRAPSILAQCVPGLMPHDSTNHTITNVPARDHNFLSPTVEIVPSKTSHPYKCHRENMEFQGLNIFKGGISVSDIKLNSVVQKRSMPNLTELVSWFIDLVNVLKHEIRDGQLTFRGKRVLGLNCGYGLQGSFLTKPTTEAESLITPLRQSATAEVHFDASDFDELNYVLSVVKQDCIITGMSQCSLKKISWMWSKNRPQLGLGNLNPSMGKANESNLGEDRYDVNMMTEIQHSVICLNKQCLWTPYGVLYLTIKKSHHISHCSRNLRRKCSRSRRKCQLKKDMLEILVEMHHPSNLLFLWTSAVMKTQKTH